MPTIHSLKCLYHRKCMINYSDLLRHLYRSQGHISDSVQDCHSCIRLPCDRLTLTRHSSSLGPYAGDTKAACGCVIATVRLIHLHCNNTRAGHCSGKLDSFSIFNHAERPLTKAGHFNVILFTKLHFQVATVLKSFRVL